MPYLAAGLAIGSGLLSLFSESAQEAKMREQLKRAKSLARQGLISKEELANRLSSIDRLFNQRLNMTLRSTQLGGRRYANANVVGAGVAGQLGAQAEASKVDYTAGVDKSNAAIYQNLAQLEAGAPIADPIGAFAEGASAGGMLGMELTNTLNIGNRPSIGGGARSGTGLNTQLASTIGQNTNRAGSGTGVNTQLASTIGQNTNSTIMGRNMNIYNPPRMFE